MRLLKLYLLTWWFYVFARVPMGVVLVAVNGRDETIASAVRYFDLVVFFPWNQLSAWPAPDRIDAWVVSFTVCFYLLAGASAFLWSVLKFYRWSHSTEPDDGD